MTASRFSLRRLAADLIAVAALSVACVVYWWDVVTLKGVFFFYDHALQNFPYRLFFARGLYEGHLRLWTSSLFCGFPLFAETQGNPLYPLFPLLFEWLKPWVAYNFYTVFHYFLAGFFTYILARTFSIRRPAAVVAGLCYMFCGPIIAHTHHTNIVVGIAYLPLLLALIELTFRRRSLLFAFLLSLVTAVLMLGAQPQYIVYNAIACGVFLAWRMFLVWESESPEDGGRTALRLGTTCALSAFLGAVIAAIQLVPFAELVSHSSRGASGVSMAVGTSLPPAQLITLFLPHYFGTPGLESYWATHETGIYAEHTVFLGVGPIILALVGAIASRRRKTLFLVALATFAFLFSLGINGPMQRLFLSVPGLRSMRFPGRFAYVLALCVALLAGLGVQNLFELPDKSRLTRRLVLLGLAVMLALSALAIKLAGSYSAPLMSLSPAELKSSLGLPGTGADVLYSYLHGTLSSDVWRLVGASAAASWLILAGVTGSLPRKYLAVLCGLLVFGEMAYFARPEHAVTDPSLFKEKPRLARIIEEHGPRRIFHYHWWNAEVESVDEIVHPMKQGAARRPQDFQQSLAYLPLNSQMLWDIQNVNGFCPLQTLRLKRLLGQPENVQTMIPFGLSHPLDLLGVRYIITTERELPGDYRLMENLGHYRLFENPNALPRAFIVHRAQTYADPDQAVSALQNPSFDYRAGILLPEGSEAQTYGDGQAEDEERAHVVRDTGDSLTLTARLTRPGYLVLADQFYPGWEARVDGKEVPILRADYLLRAIHLPEGEHTVQYAYRPWSFTIGWIITVAGLLILLVWTSAATLKFATDGPPRPERPPLSEKDFSNPALNLVLFTGAVFVLASPLCNHWYWRHVPTQLDPRSYASSRHKFHALSSYQADRPLEGYSHLLKAYRASPTNRVLRAALRMRCGQTVETLLEKGNVDEAAEWFQRTMEAAPSLAGSEEMVELKNRLDRYKRLNKEGLD